MGAPADHDGRGIRLYWDRHPQPEENSGRDGWQIVVVGGEQAAVQKGEAAGVSGQGIQHLRKLKKEIGRLGQGLGSFFRAKIISFNGNQTEKHERGTNMERTIEFNKPEEKSYVQLEIRLSGRAVVLGLGALGIASGLNYFLQYLVRKYAYKTVYGRLPEEDCRIPREKKKPMGFSCEPVRSEDSD